MGVDVAVLQALENALWDEMHAAVEVKISPIISRQSSGFSMFFGEDDNDESFDRPIYLTCDTAV